MVAKISIEQREHQLKERCAELELSFDGWVDQSTITKYSKFYVVCSKGHRTEKQIKPFVNKSRPNGCYLCSPKMKTSKDSRIEEIKTLADSVGYTFVDFVGVYKDAHTKISMVCDKGHDWNVSIVAFLNQGHRCKKCATSGFNPNKPAYVYIQSLSDKFLKFGITNRTPRQRMCAQSSKSIYKHELVYQKLFDKGIDAMSIEQKIKQSLVCGVVDKSDMMDGYTETTDISNYNKLLNIIEGV